MMHRPYVLLLSCLVLFCGHGAASAQSNLWDYLPSQTHAVVQVDDPRRLYEAVLHHEAYRRLLEFESVREAYQTTNFRRLLQLLAYFEKELGHPGPELLDRLA